MKHLCLLLVIVLSLSFYGHAQKKDNTKYKSISKRNLKLDKSVPVLLREARGLSLNDPKGALDKVEEALALSITQKSSFNEASCYLVLGQINEQIEEWKLAEENFFRAFEMLNEDYRSTIEFQSSLDGLSRTMAKRQAFNQANKYLAIKLGLSTNPEVIAQTHLDMASNYYALKHYAKSSLSIDKAEEIIDREGLVALKPSVQALRAKILLQNNDVQLAEDLYQQSRVSANTSESFDQVADDDVVEETKEELIEAYSRQERVEEEINLRSQSIETNKIKGKSLKVAQEKLALSKALIKTGNTSEGIKELKDAINLADSIHDNNELAKAHRALAEAWHKQGKHGKAVESYQEYALVVDNLNKELAVKSQEKEKVLRKQQDIASMSKDLALDESEYELKETNTRLQLNRLRLQRILIYGLSILLILSLVAAWFIYRNAKESKVRGQLLALKSLRSQMNPHFIFNALNSVNQFIAMSDERSANKFLSEFSKLMRLVLDNSQRDFISLAEEKDILTLYLKLEHNRFKDKFDYQLNIGEGLPLESIEVPPMLIQPYIENAIWHGLRYRKEKGSLKVNIEMSGNVLSAEIIDNGIGRKKSQELKTEQQSKHQSTGLKNTLERIDTINRVYKKSYKVEVNDVDSDGSGTKVLLTLPQSL